MPLSDLGEAHLLQKLQIRTLAFCVLALTGRRVPELKSHFSRLLPRPIYYDNTPKHDQQTKSDNYNETLKTLRLGCFIFCIYTLLGTTILFDFTKALDTTAKEGAQVDLGTVRDVSDDDDNDDDHDDDDGDQAANHNEEDDDNNDDDDDEEDKQ
ncbi:hypothetical protein C7974DRAFT_418188 [Boeremia exigua]|uniref:uncharacterized protein n=1 Tax=Boeremia exigua TaxID=749465 RepID=UPI001E8DCF24|nr:uncharacterized protein C7974DRAFT_418188 [Boeremia exigua]KAH6613100.1 hypothetical protein C7974DRAFT_418188 [Boeremia exigua]